MESIAAKKKKSAALLRIGEENSSGLAKAAVAVDDVKEEPAWREEIFAESFVAKTSSYQ